MFLKNFAKFTENIYADVSFSIKFQVADWKETRVQVSSYEFCKNFKNDYLVEHLRTAVSDTLGYHNRQVILCKVHIEEIHNFLQHFGIHTFQIDFRILQNLRGVFRTISNIYDKGFLLK